MNMVAYWFGVACITGFGVYLARKRNRNQWGWGFFCFMFGLIPLAILFFLNPLPTAEEQNSEW
jgi:hypothetical protein